MRPSQKSRAPGVLKLAITRFTNDSLIDDVCEVLDRDGCIIIEDMISADVMDRFIADLAPWLERTPFGEQGFSGDRTRRCSALFAKSLATAEFVQNPIFLGAADAFLRPEFPMAAGEKRQMVKPSIQISVTQAIEIWPGQPAQDLHRDDGMYHAYHPGPQTLLQTLFAGTDFTAKNGATMAIPGSHKWDMDRIPTPQEAVCAEMRRGSGLLYFGSLYHGGGANMTEDERRLAIAISLTQGHRRQEENQYLVVPKETVRKYPRQVQELLGYQVSPPYCGWVEMCCPSIVLEETDFTVASSPSPHG